MKKPLLILSVSFILCFSLKAQIRYADSLLVARDLYSEGAYELAFTKAGSLQKLDKTRADGFLLASLISLKQQDLDQAKAYLAKAEGLKVSEGMFSVDFVKQAVKEREVTSLLLETAKNAQNQGNRPVAASLYTEAFLKNEAENAEHGFEAYKLWRQEKEFSKAIQVLEKLEKSPNYRVSQQAVNLLKELSQDPELRLDRQFYDYMQLAAQSEKMGQLPEAVDLYQKAVHLKPGHLDANKRIQRLNDELAFRVATEKNSMEVYEQYLIKFPEGIHRKEVDVALAGLYLNSARTYAGKGNFAEAEKHYKKHQSLYPGSGDRERVDAELCDLYFKEARKHEQLKTAAHLEKAISYYQQAEACNHRALKEGHLTKLNNKQQRWSRPNMRFWGWHGDERDAIGITGGSLNTRKIGLYMAVRLNKDFPSEGADTYWKTNNMNSVEGSEDKEKTFTGKTIERRLHATVGITKKLIHPLWIYAGGGLAINGQLREFVSEDGTVEKVSNSDQSYAAFNPEAGLHLKIGPLTLGYGLNRPLTDRFTKNYTQSFRLGIKM
ncbi:hypothetical protein [Pedobacter sp. SYSU D00535]|uniref:hypothetical protein n=1 Tax=Pedobacter sp. SYSU D00535 TaxID=2810308 RepID=UPI001A96899B|nr:hypothetical protein [Pedobacter sp. SYSU D00535]